jgi:hypothetical protein
MVFSALSTLMATHETIGYSNGGMVFSLLPLPEYYKQDNWSNKLLVKQSPTNKNVSTEADNFV